MIDALSQFRDEIRAAGLEPPDVIEPGKIHRFPGMGKRYGNTAGWCKLFDDGLGGCFGDWSSGLSENWQAKRDKPFSQSERAAFIQRVKETRKREEVERYQLHANAAKKAETIWNTAELVQDDHPYLVRKNIKANGTRLYKEALVIPVRSNGALCSLQFISADGNKRFLSDGRVTGGYFSIGSIQDEEALCITEGFATGATVHEVTGKSVIVAFNSGNLKNVVQAFRDKGNTHELVICADNDRNTDGNPGEKAAMAACKGQADVSYVLPEFKGSAGTDFNDLANLEGEEEVKRQILGESKHKKESSDPLAWLSKFKPSKEEIAMFADPEFIIEDLVIRGHLIGIVAPPNGGKTTIFFDLAGVMAKKGYEVIYVNADISASDVKRMDPIAEENGFELILPDMAVGFSMCDVVNDLEEFNNSGFDLKNYIFIFDTLKKMTDVINKQKAKKLLGLLRSLTSKGATIITLGHTNKHKGDDGQYIFEGTGDFRADVDELIYLIPEKKQDGSMTVSTRPDKIRGDIKPITFEIDSERNVRLLDDYVDVKKEHEKSSQRKKDSECIKAIEECLLQQNEVKQSDVTTYCKDEYGFSKAPVIKVLKRYTSDIWMVKDGPANNAKLYSLLRPLAYKKSAPAGKPETEETET